MKLSLAATSLAVLFQVPLAHAQSTEVVTGVAITPPIESCSQTATGTTPRTRTDLVVRGDDDEHEVLVLVPTGSADAQRCTAPCTLDTWSGTTLWSLGPTLDWNHLHEIDLAAGHDELRLVHPNTAAHGGGGALLGASILLGAVSTFAFAVFGLASLFHDESAPLTGFGALLTVSVAGMIGGGVLLGADTTPRLEHVAPSPQLAAAPVPGGAIATLAMSF